MQSILGSSYPKRKSEDSIVLEIHGKDSLNKQVAPQLSVFHTLVSLLECASFLIIFLSHFWWGNWRVCSDK